MTYAIGQRFDGVYPPEAAAWCNRNNAYIAKDGTTYTIVENPAPTPQDIQDSLTDIVQTFLDHNAQNLGYDSCLSVCSYVDTGVPKFDAEGRAFRVWRSAVWAKCYEILGEVKAGKQAIPTAGELVMQLPLLDLESYYEGE